MVVIDLTQKMVVSSIISRSSYVVVELRTIVKIRKYKRFHEGHHFIPMVAMKCTTHLCVTWIVSSRNVLVFSTINDQGVIYPFFCIQILKQGVKLVFNVL